MRVVLLDEPAERLRVEVDLPGGGSRCSVAGTPPARTIRRKLSSSWIWSIRAGVGLVTRKVWSLPTGTTAYVPGRATTVSSPTLSTTSPSRRKKASLRSWCTCRGGDPPGGTISSITSGKRGAPAGLRTTTIVSRNHHASLCLRLGGEPGRGS